MSLGSFPLQEVLSQNANSIQLAVLIMGLVEILLFHILDRKKVSNFFFQSSNLLKNLTNSSKNIDSEPSSNKKEIKKSQVVDEDDDQSTIIYKVDVETVLRSLEIFNNGEDDHIPERLNAGEMFKIFEEREPSLDEVREAFEVFDNNRDGFIDAEELQRVLCALGLKEGLMENCRRMIGAFDEDGDGRIDFDEFVKVMENSFT